MVINKILNVCWFTRGGFPGAFTVSLRGRRIENQELRAWEPAISRVMRLGRNGLETLLVLKLIETMNEQIHETRRVGKPSFNGRIELPVMLDTCLGN